MIDVKYKIHGVSIVQAWFDDSCDISKHGKSDILHFCCTANPGRTGKSHRQHTLQNDLTLTSEELLANCKSNVRNEIRRAEKDGITTAYYGSIVSKTVEDSIIEEFNNEYNVMNEKKGRNARPILDNLKHLNACNALVVSTALFNNEIVAFHAYVCDGNITRLLYSVSTFRNEDITPSIVGRANRRLHYIDMVAFKEHGYKVYDWGGYSLDENLKGISDFKAGFGGIEKDVYMTTVCKTLKGKIAMWVKKSNA